MHPRPPRPSRPLLAATLLVVVTGCGQVSVGQQSVDQQTSATPQTSSDSPSTPVPGPAAVDGCAELAGPVSRLAEGESEGEGDTGADSREVTTLAGDVADNALSAVASRISGLAVQPEVDPEVMADQWEQFRQICDLD